MSELTKVAFYYGLNAKSHIIDHLVQPDQPNCWVPALLDVQQTNLYKLMGLANISTDEWRQHLISKYDFDPAAPTAEGLQRAGVGERFLSVALDLANELAEAWADPETMLWQKDDDMPSNMSAAHVEEVLAETRGRGTPVIVFQAEESLVDQALSEDNLITVASARGVYIGLSDPINGYGWSPSSPNEVVRFRPSAEGLVVLGEHPVFDHCVEDAYSASLSFEPGEPLRLSSNSEQTSRLPPPPVRDERDQGLSLKRR